MHNLEEDDIVVTRKNKRQWTAKPFGDDYMCTLWMIYQGPLKRYIPLLMLTCGRKQYGTRWIQLCLMELRELLNVLMGVNQ
jgi:hypothetical protein